MKKLLTSHKEPKFRAGKKETLTGTCPASPAFEGGEVHWCQEDPILPPWGGISGRGIHLSPVLQKKILAFTRCCGDWGRTEIDRSAAEESKST